MNSIVITYDERFKQVSVYDTCSDCINHFEWDENFNIVDEQPSSDCEDFNDNARWLIKTLLAILKMEKDDDTAHCDWSADYDRNKDTGKYKFEVNINRLGENNETIYKYER